MDTILQMLSQAIEQLLGRASGPLHFRLFIMPIVVTVLGIRAGLRDARGGRRHFSWLRNSSERQPLFRSALKDIGRVFVVAIVLDTIYQFLMFRYLYIIQVLIIAVSCAVVPYIVMRILVTSLARGFYKEQHAAVDASASKPIAATKEHQ
jgi:hypothetical protein